MARRFFGMIFAAAALAATAMAQEPAPPTVAERAHDVTAPFPMAQLGVGEAAAK